MWFLKIYFSLFRSKSNVKYNIRQFYECPVILLKLPSNGAVTGSTTMLNMYFMEQGINGEERDPGKME